LQQAWRGEEEEGSEDEKVSIDLLLKIRPLVVHQPTQLSKLLGLPFLSSHLFQLHLQKPTKFPATSSLALLRFHQGRGRLNTAVLLKKQIIE